MKLSALTVFSNILLLLATAFIPVHPALAMPSARNECVALFASAEKRPGPLRLSKPELDVLFKIRDRIRADDSQFTRIEDPVELGLIQKISGKSWKLGSAISMPEFESDLALPAFAGLAHYEAGRRFRIQPESDIADLQQAALIGLLNTIRTYDPSKGWMFSTVAITAMKAEFYEVGRNASYGAPSASSLHTFNHLQKFLQIERKHEIRTGQRASPEFIANKFNDSHAGKGSVDAVREALARHAFTEQLATSAVNTHPEDVAGEGIESHDAYAIKVSRQAAADLLASLTPREERVFGQVIGLRILYHGRIPQLVDVDPLSVPEISKIEGVEVARIRRIVDRVKEKLSRRKDLALKPAA